MKRKTPENFINRVHLILLVAICCGFAASEVFAQGPPPDRIFGFMDRNNNDRLDPEELERMPSHFRETWEKKFDLKKGISKDDFLKKAPKMFEEARKRREEEYRSGGDDRGRGDYGRGRGDYGRGRGDYGRRGDDRDSSSSKEKTRVTVDLQETYANSDTNADGQINLKEWKSSGRGPLSLFASVDTNNDGFLTPKELANAEKNGIQIPSSPFSSNSAAPTESKSASVGASSSRKTVYTARPPVVVTSRPFSGAKVDTESAGAKEGAYYFGLMDRNRDGNIDSQEWSRSKRIKPFFEQSGADLSKPMPKEDFVRIYVQSGAVKNRG